MISRLAVALGALSLVACARSSNRQTASSPRPIGLTHAERVAYGRPATCPDDAVDVYGDGRPGPDDLRCSYDDAAGGAMIRIRGHVRREPRASDLTGTALGETTIVVQEVRADGTTGRVLARATTDPQGGFDVGAVLPAGEYLLALPSARPGPPIAFRRFSIASGTRRIDDLDLVVPAAAAGG